MKGTKKLFALVALVALVLTLTPVLKTGAAIQPVLTSVNGRWKRTTKVITTSK